MNKIFLLLLALTIVLSSCAETNSNMNSDSNSSAAEQLTESSGTEDASNPEKIGNITFACKPDKIETDEIYILTMEGGTEVLPEGMAEKLVDSLITMFNEVPDESNIKTENTLIGPVYTIENGQYVEIDQNEVYQTMLVRLDDPDFGGELYADSSSFLLWNEKDLHGPFLGYYERDVYKADNIPDKEYTMLDGSTFTASEAMKQADKYIAKLQSLGLFDEKETQQLVRIGINDTHEGIVFDFHYRQVRYGLPVNDDGMIENYPDNDHMRYPFFDIMFAGNDHPFLFRNCMSDSVESKEKVEDYMTYGEAKKRLAENLAENLEYTVTDAGLRYCCVYTDLDKYRSYRPMWCFTLDDPSLGHQEISPDREMNSQVNNMMFYPKTTAYIDAITGDIYYLNCRTHTFAKYEN